MISLLWLRRTRGGVGFTAGTGGKPVGARIGFDSQHALPKPRVRLSLVEPLEPVAADHGHQRRGVVGGGGIAAIVQCLGIGGG